MGDVEISSSRTASNKGLQSLDAIVSIKAHIPEDAMSAGLLGTERNGHGVRIREDGLIATIGYVVNEAESIWIGSPNGKTVPGFLVGYDFDSGFGLVKPTLPLEGGCMPMGEGGSLEVGETVTVAASGNAEQVIDAEIVAKQEFAGRWEYLLDEAIFTAPPHESWSGAALIDRQGRLCGLGSLVIQGFEVNGSTMTVNMFVPIELLSPIIDEICQHGRRLAPARPWMGVLVHEDQDELTIIGVYRNCPADKAGLRPGDVVLQIDGEPVEGLADMLRSIWRLGSAGVEVPITVMRDTARIDAVVQSADRAAFQHKGTVQ
jgi:S1-C subfamily serine protease